jgi:hypothetical protein
MNSERLRTANVPENCSATSKISSFVSGLAPFKAHLLFGSLYLDHDNGHIVISLVAIPAESKRVVENHIDHRFD